MRTRSQFIQGMTKKNRPNDFYHSRPPKKKHHTQHAVDFYNALTKITSGRIFPLLMADKLGDYIVGSAVETIETEKLIHEFEQVIVDGVYNKDQSVDSVAGNLQDYIKSKGIRLNTVVVEDVYVPSAIALSNVRAWTAAKSVGVAREEVKVASIF